MRPSLLFGLALLPTLSGCLGHVLDDRRGAAPAESEPPAAKEDGAGGASSGRACVPASEQGAVLAEGAGLRPLGLVPDGARVWFVNDETPEATNEDPYPNRVRSAWSVATAGGSLQRSDIQAFESGLTTFEGELAYVRSEREGAPRAIVLRNRATGNERVVRTVVNESVSDLVSHPSGLYWTSSSQATGSTLFRFTGGRAKELATDGPSAFGRLVTDAGDGYYLAWRAIDDSRNELRLESLPLAGLEGGEPRIVSRLGDDPRFTWSVIGVAGAEIFVAVRAMQPEQSSIRAIAKDGSGQRIVARVGGFASEPILDGDLLTWIDGDTGRSILQTTVAGAGITTLETSNDGRRFGSVAVDRCNVYFTAVGETRATGASIHAKARATQAQR